MYLAKEIKVKIINNSGYGLEKKIQNWLDKYPYTKIIDIKFGHGGLYDTSTSQALIIYFDDGEYRF